MLAVGLQGEVLWRDNSKLFCIASFVRGWHILVRKRTGKTTAFTFLLSRKLIDHDVYGLGQGTACAVQGA